MFSQIASSTDAWRDGFAARFPGTRIGRPALAVILGVVLALLTWPYSRLVPVPGIDGSWQAGIAMALQGGLRWGVDVVFTYGPLGFLDWPQLVVPRLGVIAWLFVAVVHLALFLAVAWLSVRNESRLIALPIALAGALLAARIVPTTALLLMTLAICIELLRRDAHPKLAHSPRANAAVVALLGALGALVLLIKLNDGMAILGVVAMTAIAIPPRRVTVPAFAFMAGLTLITLWLGARQQPADLAAYVTTGREIIAGYSTAMGVDDPTRAWEYGAVLITGLLGAWSTWRATRRWRPISRTLVAAMVGVAGFLMFKQAFVRHGGAGYYEAIGLVIVWVLPWRRPDRSRRILILAAISIATLGTSRADVIDRLNPAGVGVAVSRAATMLSTPDRVEAIEAARAKLRTAYAIPGSMLVEMRGGSVHVEPFETAVVWAYPELSWRPLPVMQPYSAYTTRLDELNADRLADASGPSLILRSRPMSIDQRQPFYESPRATLEEVCRFREIDVSRVWELLARRPSRCGAPRAVSTATVVPGQLIAVPDLRSSDELLVAHIHGLETGPVATLRALLDKSPAWWVALDDKTYRLVPETASGPLILSAPTSLGWTAPFGPPTGIRSLAVGMGSGSGLSLEQPDARLTIAFEAIPFTP